jgi:hypothetical protein
MRIKVYLFSEDAKARAQSFSCLFCQYLQTEVKEVTYALISDI